MIAANVVTRFLAAVAAAALVAAAPGIAAAQTDMQAEPPPPASAVPPGPPPSYARPAPGEQIRGSITAITGKYSLQVRDDRGFLDNIALHQGTIINPTGLTLAPGMQVTITGSNAGPVFAAQQIDAPYAIALIQAPVPYVGFGLGFGGWGWGPRYRAGFWW
jgi:hypothetical protein